MQPDHGLRRVLGPWDAFFLNIGAMIGSGIFIVPANIALQVEGLLPTLGVWLLGGLVSLFGALALAELGAANPRAGGLYVYLHDAYQPVFGFLYGWASFGIINSASIAAVAIVFATTLCGIFGLSSPWDKVLALSAIALLTWANIRDVQVGAWVQNLTSTLKLAGMAVLIGLGLWLTPHPSIPLPALFSASSISWSALGVAMVAVLWSYDGWIEATYAAGEVRDPQKNLPRALIFSVLIVVLVYTLFNAVILRWLPHPQLLASQAAATDAAAAMLGGSGSLFIALVVAIATFSACNGFILGAARIYYAMARDRLFFPSFGQVHPRFKTPHRALIAQAVWSALLALSGRFDQLFSYVMFASWLFYGLSVAAVIRMRFKAPHQPRPYRAWGYPFTPLLFLVFTLWLTGSAILDDPFAALYGCLFLASGFPAYRWFIRRTAGAG